MDNPLVDKLTLGRIFRAARIYAGLDSVSGAAQAIKEKTGLEVSDRTIYAVERGEQLPSIEQFMAFLITYSPPRGGDFLLEAFREDVRQALRPRNNNHR